MHMGRQQRDQKAWRASCRNSGLSDGKGITWGQVTPCALRMEPLGAGKIESASSLPGGAQLGKEG